MTHKYYQSITLLKEKSSKESKTVLVQDHFYSFYLLFAPANKTKAKSRMIISTLLSGNGI